MWCDRAIDSYGHTSMPVSVALYQKEIGGRTFAFDTGDISFGDAETKEVLKNISTDILRIPLRKRNVTFTIRGANATDIETLYAARDNTITQLVNATSAVAGEDIVIGGDTLYNCILIDVQAGPPITVAGIPLIEQVTVRYDSTVYV